MTTERTTGNTAGIADKRVSGTYRDIATERAPASLNERVLREARAHAGSGYSYWMGWLRPMAWAATVGLCFAIVVQLTDIPEPDPETFELPRVPETLKDDALMETDARGATSDADANQFRQNRPAEKKETGKLPSPAAVAAPRREDSANAVGRAPETVESKAKASANREAYRVTDAPILEEAAEMARLREGPKQEPAATRPLARQADAGYSIATENCDEDTRNTPESWLKCIVEIEQQGGNADDERALLNKYFPEFELP